VILLIGLDGVGLDIVLRWKADLPHLSALLEAGTSAPLESTLPYATLPAWTTALTGVGPGRHGVFDFTRREGYRVKFVGGTVRRMPTVFARLARSGRRVAALGFPGTFPPEELPGGLSVSGWDSPVAATAGPEFVRPRSRHGDLVRLFGGPLVFDDADEFDGGPGWHEALGPHLERRIGRRADLYEDLIRKDGPWDVFACYFGETDTAAHHLWALSDPASPRRPAIQPARDPLLGVYRAADEAVGRLASACEDVDVVVCSDHGAGGASDRVVYLNRLLAEAGLLRLRRSARLASRAKDAALRLLPPRVRERAFRLGGNVLASRLESQVRFGGIDWSKTVAFSEELNYAPSVCLNLRGREPQGKVDPADRSRVLRDVVSALGPLVAEAHPREAIYDGPETIHAPDLVLDLAREGDYSVNLLPSSTAPDGPSSRRMQPEEHLGRKARAPSGSHRRHGILVARGKGMAAGARIEAGVADVAAILHEWTGVSPDLALDGRTPDRDADQAALASRLRALGYV